MTVLNSFMAGSTLDPAHIHGSAVDAGRQPRLPRAAPENSRDRRRKSSSDSYDRENRFTTEAQWREWCTEKREHCTIGTFIGNELIGIMGIVWLYGPPETLVE